MDSTFTIISLMIGVFGATTSVIFLFKSECNSFIDKHIKDAETKFSEVSEKKETAPKTFETMEKSRNKMQKVGGSSKNALWFPIIFFAFWAFTTSFYISIDNNYQSYFNNTASDVEGVSKTVLLHYNKIEQWFSIIIFSRFTILIMSLIDLVAIGYALYWLHQARSSYQKIKDLHQAFLEFKSATINKT